MKLIQINLLEHPLKSLGRSEREMDDASRASPMTNPIPPSSFKAGNW